MGRAPVTTRRRRRADRRRDDADLCDRLRARSPITIADVARDAGYKSTGTLKRAVGVLKQPARSSDTPAFFTEAIKVDDAGAIVRALGLATTRRAIEVLKSDGPPIGGP